MECWRILVVDDEEDVHEVTRLAFKRRLWRGRPFELLHAHSAEEARTLLAVSDHAASIQVALVDVVMETEDAGLMLCRHIRGTCPTSLRIILRTGQPGRAPAETALIDYDIDCYLAKSEVTASALFSSVCASLRSSQDISTLLALGKQIQNFTKALRRISTIDDLLVFMHEGLHFLESKYGMALAFYYDIAQAGRMLEGLEEDPDDRGQGVVTTSPSHSVPVSTALLQAFTAGQLKDMDVYPGSTFGQPEGSYIVPFSVTDEQTKPIYGALIATAKTDRVNAKALADFQADALLFLENWRIAYGSLLLQERSRRETMLRQEMHRARLQSIAQMVTGIAHEVNTPLGVANTANSMITSLIERILASPPDGPEMKELLSDLTSTSGLLSKNLLRAHSLIRSFKQLSVGQLSDQRIVSDLHGIVSDCLHSLSPEMRKGKLEAKFSAPDGALTWDGYPGHLSQVLVNLIQNTLKYAYPKGGGAIELRLTKIQDDNRKGIRDGFRIEVQDFGAGISPKVRPRLFEPFATSSMGNGGTGLGLAISRNIVHDLLHGQIEVFSEVGKGTTFVIDLPRVVIDDMRVGA